jgi:hypothetical protein
MFTVSGGVRKIGANSDLRPCEMDRPHPGVVHWDLGTAGLDLDLTCICSIKLN